MKIGIAIICFGFILASCLKKIDEADNLNSNIFDKEYSGDCWFDVVDCYTFQNQFGQTLVRTEAVLYESRMPGLKPSSVKINCRVNNQSELSLTISTDDNGDYPFYYDAILETSNIYCFKAGLYLEDEDTVINRFEVCTEL